MVYVVGSWSLFGDGRQLRFDCIDKNSKITVLKFIVLNKKTFEFSDFWPFSFFSILLDSFDRGTSIPVFIISDYQEPDDTD